MFWEDFFINIGEILIDINDSSKITPQKSKKSPYKLYYMIIFATDKSYNTYYTYKTKHLLLTI